MQKHKENIHAPSGIHTHDPSNQVAKTYALERGATWTGHITTQINHMSKVSDDECITIGRKCWQFISHLLKWNKMKIMNTIGKKLLHFVDFKNVSLSFERS
jgi:hypothetical protein